MLKINFRTRIIVFICIIIGGAALVSFYVFRSPRSTALDSAETLTGIPAEDVSIEEKDIAIQKDDKDSNNKNDKVMLVLGLSGVPQTGPTKGAVAFLLPDGTAKKLSLVCNRAYYAGGSGICLRMASDIYADRGSDVIVFEKDGTVRFTVHSIGIPSRARVSRDGAYAAFTTFVSGGSYADGAFHTHTAIIDTRKGSIVLDFDTIEVWQGKGKISAPDFDFWGVTFAANPHTFYVTVRYGGKSYLAKGTLGSNKLEVLAEGVECPSLSPDGTRIAFKKSVGVGVWRLAVLDLKSMKITTLNQGYDIDDQAEWLDDNHILYGIFDQTLFQNNIMVIPVDNASAPKVFKVNTFSPAVSDQD